MGCPLFFSFTQPYIVSQLKIALQFIGLLNYIWLHIGNNKKGLPDMGMKKGSLRKGGAIRIERRKPGQPCPGRSQADQRWNVSS